MSFDARRQGRLILEVRLMNEPCLWRWEIRDPARDRLVESSWAGEWMAYNTADEAYRAGRQRLSSLTSR